MFVIRFLRGYPPYQAGEVAGFAPATAHRFVTDGIAELVHGRPLAEGSSANGGPPVDKMQRPVAVKRPVAPAAVGRPVVERFHNPAERARAMVREGVAVDHATALAIGEPRPPEDAGGA